MQASTHPPTFDHFVTPPRSPTRKQYIRPELKDTPPQGLKNSTANGGKGRLALDAKVSRGNQAFEMDEQLAQVSLEEFTATLLSDSAELGSPPKTMPDCEDFLRREYPNLRNNIANAKYTGAEAGLYPSGSR